MPACYLELHEEGEVEISTCIWHKYKDMAAILSTCDKIIKMTQRDCSPIKGVHDQVSLASF